MTIGLTSQTTTKPMFVHIKPDSDLVHDKDNFYFNVNNISNICGDKVRYSYPNVPEYAYSGMLLPGEKEKLLDIQA